MVSPLCEGEAVAGVSPSGKARWESPACGDSAQRLSRKTGHHKWTLADTQPLSLSRVSLSDAMSGNARRTPRPSTAPCDSSSRIVNRHGHHSRFRNVPASIETRNGRCDSQLRVEVNESISGRMDMLNSINTALQNVSGKPNDSTPYRISDFLPRNWEGSNEKVEFRSFMTCRILSFSSLHCVSSVELLGSRELKRCFH